MLNPCDLFAFFLAVFAVLCRKRMGSLTRSTGICRRQSTRPCLRARTRSARYRWMVASLGCVIEKKNIFVSKLCNRSLRQSSTHKIATKKLRLLNFTKLTCVTKTEVHCWLRCSQPRSGRLRCKGPWLIAADFHRQTAAAEATDCKTSAAAGVGCRRGDDSAVKSGDDLCLYVFA